MRPSTAKAVELAVGALEHAQTCVGYECMADHVDALAALRDRVPLREDATLLHLADRMVRAAATHGYRDAAAANLLDAIDRHLFGSQAPKEGR